MTPNEIQILICGIAIGTELMVLLHAYWNWRDARRADAAARRQARLNAADTFLNSFRLQHRSRV